MSELFDDLKKKATEFGNDVLGSSVSTDQISALYGNQAPRKYQFPTDLESHAAYMCLAPLQLSRNDRFSNQNKKALDYIFLPTPFNLRTSYNANWSQEELGILGGAIADQFRQGTIEGGKLASAAGTAMAMNTVSFLASGFGLDLKEITSNAFRAAVNPHYALIFKGTNFRSFVFNYRFVARSMEESETINAITNLIKYYSAPGSNASLTLNSNLLEGGKQSINLSSFSYPALWQINFLWKNMKGQVPGPSGVNTFLFQPALCALTSFDVDYGTEGGIPAFQQDNGAPVTVSISMSFTETEIITRESIKASFNTPNPRTPN